ncbi:MAG: hypothetical protein N2053_12370, partial [Chitinispirillaceae bacterium]|nr:hypothetical protein [Chitinispirillaceae bacterium]
GVILLRRAYSTLWNPAAASFLNKYEFTIEGADLYGHISQHGCIAVTAPIHKSIGAAISYQPFYSGVIEEYDSISPSTVESGIKTFSPTGYFKNYHHLFTLSSARKLSWVLPRFSETDIKRTADFAAGVNIKAYLQTMNLRGYRYIGMGYNFDFGLAAKIVLDTDLKTGEMIREFIVGATIRDFFPSNVKWIYSVKTKLYNSPQGYREPFSSGQYYGIAYIDKSGDFFADWTIALCLHKEYGKITYHGGIEAEIFKTICFRIGLSDRIPTLGAGIKYKNFFTDYALRFDEINPSYIRLTLGVFF